MLNRKRLALCLARAKTEANLPSLQPPWIEKIHLVETTPSTSAMVWQLLEQGAGAGTVAIAAQQTAGRGQWGRTWVSALGGLYFSVVLTPCSPAQDSPQLTMAVAWGIAKELRRWGIPVQLKWPNDLVLTGRKLGGILTETRVQQGRLRQAVVGVGINWENAPPDPGICLRSFLQGRSAAELPDSAERLDSLEQLAAIAMTGVFSGYHLWQQEGIGTLLPAYTQFLDSLGRTICVEGQQGQIVGISPAGELLVRLTADISLTMAGEPAATAALTGNLRVKPGAIQLGYGDS